MSTVPPAYTRQATFTSFHTEPAPTVGQDLEAEFNAVKQSQDATQSRVAEIQRDDGKLKNLAVHPDSLSQAVRALLAITAGGPLTPAPSGQIGSSSVLYTASAAGAVVRTQASKNSDTVSAKDFGAVGDGVANDTAAVDAAEAALAGGGVLYFPKGTYSITNGRPPANVTWRFEGTPVDRTTLGGAASFKAQRASYSYLDGPHATLQYTGEYIRTLAKGSGAIGQQFCDQALAVHVEKEFWSETSGTPQAGEIDGLTIMYRQGGPRVGGGDPLAGTSSGAAVLCNVQATQGSGASQILEAVNTVVDVPGLAINRNIGVQLGMINTRDSDYYGAVLISNVGTQDAAIKVDGVGASAWGRIIENIKNGINNYNLEDTGRQRWRTTGGTNISLDLDDATGELIFRNNSSTDILRIGQTRITAIANTPRTNTATTDTITESDHARIVQEANAAAITVTLSATARAGTSVRVIQRDAGQVTFTPAGGATLRNRSSHTKTAGLYAAVTLEVAANTGSAAIWYLSGDTAA